MGQELLANGLILDWFLLIKRPALSKAKHKKRERGHDQQHWDGLKQPKGNQLPHGITQQVRGRRAYRGGGSESSDAIHALVD